MRHNRRMGELTRRVLNEINNAEEVGEMVDCIGIASDLIRRSFSTGYQSGIEDIDKEEVGDNERTQLQDALLKALPRSMDPQHVCPILHALKGTSDPTLKPLLVEYLANYLRLLKGSNAVVFTILLALSDLGEPIFVGKKSRCSIDIEINVQEAQNYLLRRGIKVPG
jgi:hypothetical protein